MQFLVKKLSYSCLRHTELNQTKFHSSYEFRKQLKLALYSYYDKNNDFSVFHLNINSLQYHFDELQTFFIKLSH